MNQAFNTENFLKILYNENMKGLNLESKFFPQVYNITQQIKAKNIEIRQNYGCKEKLSRLYKEKDTLIQQKRNDLIKELDSISKSINSIGFKPEIFEFQIENKKVYSLNENKENFFFSKQLQSNIAKIYKVKQTNRHLISEELSKILSDGFPKFILKTDIKNFYESIDQGQLLKFIFKENLLTPQSKKFIKMILDQYNSISGSKKMGIPRGIGVSAYLAELYLRKLDKRIEILSNVTYYTRYVDDVIIVFTPENKNEEIIKYKDEVLTLFQEENFNINDEKTSESCFRDCNSKFDISFLGYRYKWNNKKLKIGFTNRKMQRYREKIDKTFEAYNITKMNDENKARKLLKKRLRFLMNNTRLVSYNKKVFVGIYYSNPHINNISDIDSLDKYINGKYIRLLPDNIKESIKKYCFRKGFMEKKYSPFKPTDIQQIVKIWKNVK